jgi:DNA-binding NarL/FixJ family response regulator
MNSARTLTKLAKLEDDIVALKGRIDAKLNERQLLLASLAAQGTALQNNVAAQVAVLTQANTLATTGRNLTDDQVRDIRRLFAGGMSQSAIARKYGLSQPSIFKIVRRQSYQDVA